MVKSFNAGRARVVAETAGKVTIQLSLAAAAAAELTLDSHPCMRTRLYNVAPFTGTKYSPAIIFTLMLSMYIFVCARSECVHETFSSTCGSF